ncbi:cupin domain-containing protein [Mucilaginibacter ginsenosidivorax]|uniref:Cupin domain-containing protein n=1 Tax=Mucilaginibacter ginsenosidivorax TaxID=862126 RepID=A0A5B8W5L0_9SPHI|nr:cupin domain-containing protein [Mucilaginibacter ginsenosidivorax]QEC77528.1 cupin domain-containing protein [Mucilaginibacter ginsenosidivorax]
MENNAAYWINKLNLMPHPEGGFYKEVFRSEIEVKAAYSNKLKQAITSIYYLLEGDDYSGFHRLKSDEIWYFHKGSPLHIHVLTNAGLLQSIELSDLETGNLSVVIPAGLWFAAEIPSKQGYCLASCAVAPGFDFSEFEMAEKDALCKGYPQYEGLIGRLCR